MSLLVFPSKIEIESLGFVNTENNDYELIDKERKIIYSLTKCLDWFIIQQTDIRFARSSEITRFNGRVKTIDELSFLLKEQLLILK